MLSLVENQTIDQQLLRNNWNWNMKWISGLKPKIWKPRYENQDLKTTFRLENEKLGNKKLNSKFTIKIPFSVARLSLNPLVMFVIQVQSLGKRLNFSFWVYLKKRKNKKQKRTNLQLSTVPSVKLWNLLQWIWFEWSHPIKE